MLRRNTFATYLSFCLTRHVIKLLNEGMYAGSLEIFVAWKMVYFPVFDAWNGMLNLAESRFPHKIGHKLSSFESKYGKC